MRTFIAFKLPPEIEDHVRGLQEQLKAEGLQLRWVSPANIHLTLRFLGEIETSSVDSVAAAVDASGGCTAPIDLVVQGLGVFPNLRRPNVLWTGLGGQLDAMQQLHARLEYQLELSGFAGDRRPFRPHLTLARIKGRINCQHLRQVLQDMGDFEPAPFTAGELILFRSDLRPQGAVYTPLARKKLG